MTYCSVKTCLAQRTAALLPQRAYYAEPFCGSFVALLSKAPSRPKTVSDVDGI